VFVYVCVLLGENKLENGIFGSRNPYPEL
jgi:hypothetical protein